MMKGLSKLPWTQKTKKTLALVTSLDISRNWRITSTLEFLIPRLAAVARTQSYNPANAGAPLPLLLRMLQSSRKQPKHVQRELLMPTGRCRGGREVEGQKWQAEPMWRPNQPRRHRRLPAERLWRDRTMGPAGT
eukprot:CAMPEP_0204086052 /NCGR_PEP_ID=MMETSP0360-20130528/182499_1 /ASSEMBLY_ACC=CAM_ASM_000342 /TAXON_ID=268821 /ORGANISM="Scrippsiella Hangoei, Strain SHTV-5" /LENGTH=133 /DNA_ID=CAMNT_0051035133 /DNA_START=64 /DNA_END=463 /DNA_ORIENTATION=+